MIPISNTNKSITFIGTYQTLYSDTGIIILNKNNKGLINYNELNYIYNLIIGIFILDCFFLKISNINNFINNNNNNYNYNINGIKKEYEQKQLKLHKLLNNKIDISKLTYLLYENFPSSYLTDKILFDIYIQFKKYIIYIHFKEKKLNNKNINNIIKSIPNNKLNNYIIQTENYK